jgi:hypothetical protein
MHRRLTLIPAAVVAALAVAPAAHAAPSRCHSSDLKATIAFGDGSASAGHQTGALLLENTSSRTCTVRGYPGVSFVDGDGHRLGQPAKRMTGQRIQTLTLDHGHSAAAELTLTDVDVYDRSSCRPVDATGLRIYPPDETAALFARRTLRTCRGSERVASIGPVEHQSDLPSGTT